MLLTELFTPKAIAAHWNEDPSNKIDYLGSVLFPAAKKASLDLKWFLGSNGLPISLMPSAFDAKATFRDRPGLTVLETEMPFFREGFKVKEKDRQEILRVQESGDPYAREILGRLFNDADELIRGAAVVPERMIMQLLFPDSGNMGISFTANGVAYVYDYDPGDVWKGTNYFVISSNPWTAPLSSDPFTDLKTAKDAVKSQTGEDADLAIMNSFTFGLMAQSDAIKSRFLSTTGRAVGYISDADVAQIIKDLLGITVVVYDKRYKNESGVAAKFVPDYYVSLVPNGKLGNTWYGTTPEEADLRGGASDAQVAIVNTGVAVTQIVDAHPVNVNTFASEIVLPSFERMNSCALLKVGSST